MSKDNTSSKKYSEEDILAAVRNLADELGKTPTRQELEEHGAVSSTVCYNRFGSWNNTLQEAGFQINKEHNLSPEYQKKSRDELKAAIRALADKLGRTPTRPEMNEHGEVSGQLCHYRFGTWNDALREAGLSVSREMEITREALIADLQRIGDELGRVPKVKELGEYDGYSEPVYYDRFGSWPKALEAAGFEPPLRMNIPRDELLTDLERLGDELGRKPRQAEVTEHGEFSVQAYKSEFGSWANAVEALGYTAGAVVGAGELKESLHSAYETLGHPPSILEAQEQTGHSVNTFKHRLGLLEWSDVLKAADIPVPESRKIPLGTGWEETRVERLEHDGYECVVCGRSKEELGRHPDVHHIIPREKFLRPNGTLDPEADKQSNLVTLCREHHKRWEGIPLRPMSVE